MSVPVCTIRFLISVVCCCWKVIIWLKYLALSPLVSVSTLHVIDFNFLSCVRALVAKNSRLSWMNPDAHSLKICPTSVSHLAPVGMSNRVMTPT